MRSSIHRFSTNLATLLNQKNTSELPGGPYGPYSSQVLRGTVCEISGDAREIRDSPILNTRHEHPRVGLPPRCNISRLRRPRVSPTHTHSYAAIGLVTAHAWGNINASGPKKTQNLPPRSQATLGVLFDINTPPRREISTDINHSYHSAFQYLINVRPAFALAVGSQLLYRGGIALKLYVPCGCYLRDLLVHFALSLTARIFAFAFFERHLVNETFVHNVHPNCFTLLPVGDVGSTHACGGVVEHCAVLVGLYTVSFSRCRFNILLLHVPFWGKHILFAVITVSFQ